MSTAFRYIYILALKSTNRDSTTTTCLQLYTRCSVLGELEGWRASRSFWARKASAKAAKFGGGSEGAERFVKSRPVAVAEADVLPMILLETTGDGA